jgi:hypothetical protein
MQWLSLRDAGFEILGMSVWRYSGMRVSTMRGMPVLKLVRCWSRNCWDAGPETAGMPVPTLLGCWSQYCWDAGPETAGMPVSDLLGTLISKLLGMTV